MNQEKMAFLLDMLISKTIGPMEEIEDFILHYRLDEFTTEQVFNTIDEIANELTAGTTITYLDVLQRIGPFYQIRMGSGGPALFVADAFKVYAPEAWTLIKNT